MSQEWVCVHHAANLEEAEVVAAWLDEQAIETFIKDRNITGILPGLSAVAAQGVEVCVADDETANRARKLLEEHFAEQRRAHAPAGPPEEVFQAVCEECGKSTSFHREDCGKVQSCSHCGAYMDLPEV